MTRKVTGHWKGDPNEHCGMFRLDAGSQRDAKKLALLKRVTDDDETFEQLLDAARAILEAKDAAAEALEHAA
jgi:hypothetical protein